MSTISRRRFLEDSLFAAAAAAAAATARQVLAADEKKVSPLERLRVATIGCNGQGGSHIRSLKANKDVELVAICDVDRAPYDRQIKGQYRDEKKTPEYVRDLRKLLERRDIDAVTIAT